MKIINKQFFVIFGAILLILMTICLYFFITNPDGLRPLLFGRSTQTQSSNISGSGTENTADTNVSTVGGVSGGFELSSAQIEALVSLGIDRSAVPSSVSAEQETCFVGALGGDRVEEIKAGAVPNAIEFLKAKSCI